MLFSRRLAAVVFAGLVGLSADAAAQERHTAVYRAAILGVPLGDATFVTRLTGDRYRIDGSLRSAGLASLVTNVSGTNSVSGAFTPSGASGEAYRLQYSADERAWSSEMSLSSGRVTRFAVGPPRRTDSPTFVPLDRSDLSAVSDPLSGLMIRASGPGEVCGRTLRVFDGWTRLDMRLAPAGTTTVTIPGHSGPAAVCTATIRPVSGYNSRSRGLNYVREREITMHFAPLARPDIWVPAYVRIPTTVGALTLTATSVSTE